MRNSAVFLTVLTMMMTLCVSAEGTVIIEPANDYVTPTQFGFDLVINNPDSVSAQAFQTTITIIGPTVTLDVNSSEAVVDDLDYWIYGNSDAGAIILGVDAFQFGDGPDDGNPEALLVDDIVSRYVFNWDTAGLYVVLIELDENSSFVLNDNFSIEGLGFTPGSYEGDFRSFNIYIPEPATFVFLILGGSAVLRKRRR